MKYSLRADHIVISDLDRQLLDEKIDRIAKHLLVPFIADVTIKKNTRHHSGNLITCIINIEQGKRVFHAERTSHSIQNAVDESIDAIKAELRKEHDRRKP